MGVLARIWYSGREDRGQAQNFWRVLVWHTDGCSATTAFARTRPLCALIGQEQGSQFLIGQKSLPLLNSSADWMLKVTIKWSSSTESSWWCHERMIAVFLPFSVRLHMICSEKLEIYKYKCINPIVKWYM